VKIDLSIETIENGFILTIGEQKYFCSNSRVIGRRLITILNPDGLPKEFRKGVKNEFMKEKMTNFWKDKIGELQAQIIDMFKIEQYLTVLKVTEKLYPKYKKFGSKKSVLWNAINTSFKSLTKRGFIKRVSAKSKKYELIIKKNLTEEK